MEQSRSYRFNCWLSDDPEKWILSASRAADDQWWITAFTGLSESAVRDRQLQLIQNAAAWVITRTKKKTKKNPKKQFSTLLKFSDHCIGYQLLTESTSEFACSSINQWTGHVQETCQISWLSANPPDLSGRLVLDYWLFPESKPYTVKLLLDSWAEAGDYAVYFTLDLQCF